MYGYKIESDWSNVTPKLFDQLIEESGFTPPKRDFEDEFENSNECKEKRSLFNVLRRFDYCKTSAKSSFHHVIDVLFDYDMDDNLPMSLLERFGQEADIMDLLKLYEEDINGLFYYDQSMSPPVRKVLGVSNKNYLKKLIGFAEYFFNLGRPTFDNWLVITH